MVPSPTVLHVLSQRPSLTGSGVTLDAIVSEAARNGWNQHVAAGTPFAAGHLKVGALPDSHIHPLLFDKKPVDFPVPGMSDVMPYRSTRFSSMTPQQITLYRDAWKQHLARVIELSKPTLIHSHHVWLVSSLLKDVAPETPVVTHCHATGLRQMDLCPHLADQVRDGCRRNDRILVLRQGHAMEIGMRLDIAADRVHIIGAGYRQDLFHPRGRVPLRKRIVYAGKYSNSKGVPWLLEAFRRLRSTDRHIELHIAGSGSGAEAEQIGEQIAALEGVTAHGRLDQMELATLLRTATVFVLPSFYEGVPLVLVEAAACGCRIVATDLPGVQEELAPALSKTINLVPLPALRSVDQPEPADLPRFVDNLTTAIEESLHENSRDLTNQVIERLEHQFSWSAVFRRIEKVWCQLSGTMPVRG